MASETPIRHCDTSDMRFPHGLLRDAFARAESLIGSAGTSNRERAEAVATFYENVLAFLRAHHGSEDALIWPLLRERAPEEKSLLDRMEGQHAAVDEVTGAADRAIAAYRADPSAATGDALLQALRRLSIELHVHLVEEEQEILPLAANHLTEAEWGAMPAWAVQHYQGDKFWIIAGLIFEQMTEDEVQTTLRHQPPHLREMWETTGERDFKAFMTDLSA
jgi:hypothetical protein